MSNDYRACTYAYDSGRTCNSAAAQGREFCGYHLRYRGRLLRMAEASNIQRAAKKLLAEKLAATGKKTPVSVGSDAAESAPEESKNTA